VRPAAPPAADAGVPPCHAPAAAARTALGAGAAGKVYDLLDAVGEADLGARRIEQTTTGLLALAAEQARWTAVLRAAAGRPDVQLPPDVALAVQRLAGAGRRRAGLRPGAARAGGGLPRGHGAGPGRHDGRWPWCRSAAPSPRCPASSATSPAPAPAVRLETAGDDVEIDKQVLDGVADALKHLVVNAVDHGCELPAVRRAAGKPARPSSGSPPARWRAPWCSRSPTTAAAWTRTGCAPRPSSSACCRPAARCPARRCWSCCSRRPCPRRGRHRDLGRGVGLDVVRDAVEELGGSIEVRSALGTGTAFVLTVPVTLGVVRCLLARVGTERYAVPVHGVVESVSLRPGQGARLHALAGAAVIVRDGVSVPLLDLGVALGLAPEPGAAPGSALVVRHGGAAGSLVAWAVDRLDGERELVVKDLGGFLGRVPGIAGATIDGDGGVVCLLDLRELADRSSASSRSLRRRPLPAGRRHAGPGCWSWRTASACASWSGSSSRAPATWSRPRSTGSTGPPGCATIRPTWCCPTSRCPAWTASH
jgi:hypothetical protein